MANNGRAVRKRRRQGALERMLAYSGCPGGKRTLEEREKEIATLKERIAQG